MAIEDLIGKLLQLDNCTVFPPVGYPVVKSGLPKDILDFYSLTGGVKLYVGEEYSIDIVPPSQFLLANPILVGKSTTDDISCDWYIIAQSDLQYITVDLSTVRNGRCYDSFWDTHAVAGNCQVLARNFESLLSQLIENKGEYWYWLKPSFVSLGDAYDN